ncbi:hypothetical protein OQA88_2241 [Cercophora sp. LCS_1]
MASSPEITAVSAPGKVMLAGGYLVLDRDYTGLVFGLSARIHVVAQDIRTSQGVHLTEIVVESPQFTEAQWRYGFHLTENFGGIKVTQLHSSLIIAVIRYRGGAVSKNPFVEATLNYVLTYITNVRREPATAPIKSSRLTILADNDYYSQSHLEHANGSNSSAGRFARFPVRLQDAHKTGLGSSAALVTALTAALLTHYLPNDIFDLNSQGGHNHRILHNLAQAAHCHAQGKVGSGFDVAAAVYGPSLYRRFSESILKSLPEPGAPRFSLELGQVIHGQGLWDTEVMTGEASLPTGVALRMIDVDCGSQTVGMVKQVLTWRSSYPDAAKALWNELQQKNEALAAVLKNGRTHEIRDATHAVRALVREMGNASGVPIEPQSQTELLDDLEGVQGVYGGVVPGAGGYDAIALLVKDDEETTANITSFLRSYPKDVKARLLDVKGEMEGVRKVKREDFGIYDGWLA